MGKLNNGFDNNELDQDCVRSANETHIVFNIDKGSTRGFVNDQELCHDDVTSRSEVMTMLVGISDGLKQE